MNKRIKELAERATTYIKPTANSGEGWIFDKEKFAELIVRECIEVVKWTPSQFPNDEYVKNIKEHFGVKEPKGYQPTGWVCPKCGTDRTKAACPRGRGAATDGSCPMFGVAQ